MHILDAYMKMMHVQAQGAEREKWRTDSVLCDTETVVVGDGPGLKPQLQFPLLQGVIVKFQRNRIHQRHQLCLQARSHFHLVHNNSALA